MTAWLIFGAIFVLAIVSRGFRVALGLVALLCIILLLWATSTPTPVIEPSASHVSPPPVIEPPAARVSPPPIAPAEGGGTSFSNRCVCPVSNIREQPAGQMGT